MSRCLLFASLFLVACTPIGSPPSAFTTHIVVDAAADGREDLTDLTIVVESQLASSWRLVSSERFAPRAWPVETNVALPTPLATAYLITATSRDDDGVIVAEARHLSTSTGDAIQLRFDAECMHRSKLCGRTETCSRGVCIDAASDESNQPAPADATASGTGQVAVAAASSSCGDATARACAADAEQPLLCQGGQWAPVEPCANGMRCDTSNSD